MSDYDLPHFGHGFLVLERRDRGGGLVCECSRVALGLDVDDDVCTYVCMLCVYVCMRVCVFYIKNRLNFLLAIIRLRLPLQALARRCRCNSPSCHNSERFLHLLDPP